MSSYPKEPRIEPDSVYEPDAPDDTEAKKAIGQALIEAIYFAAEEGSPYQGKHGQFARLLRLVAEALDHEEATAAEPVTDRKAEARDILAREYRYFGKGFDGAPLWQDARLLELRQWLARPRS